MKNKIKICMCLVLTIAISFLPLIVLADAPAYCGHCGKSVSATFLGTENGMGMVEQTTTYHGPDGTRCPRCGYSTTIKCSRTKSTQFYNEYWRYSCGSCGNVDTVEHFHSYSPTYSNFYHWCPSCGLNF